MRVFQLMPTIAAGDAVSNDAIAIGKVLEKMGFKTGIFAENIDKRLPSGTASHISRMPRLTSADTVLYHLSVGSELNFSLEKLKAKKGIIYHNITPSYFFRPYNGELTELLDAGRKGAAHLADKADFCMADSEYNKKELMDLGYKCDIAVRPVLIQFSDYSGRPDPEVIKQYDSDGFVNFLFVGRVAPNKKHEDIIRTFNCYQKYCNPKSRLIFVGSWEGTELYYKRLLRYVQALELQNVIFTGHVSFAKMIAYYQIADIFLCMSEHEGFCVPLVEAMYFGVPIIAYDACAVPDTLGGAGFLLHDKDPLQAAMAADRILTDTVLRREIIGTQRKRQQDFAYNTVKKQFEEQLHNFLK
ncbi:MAG: glycosyltransferase [Oscillospiraceae bacterium]|nr:glycosyltransferase [Oscillospiraceae bacterium]